MLKYVNSRFAVANPLENGNPAVVNPSSSRVPEQYGNEPHDPQPLMMVRGQHTTIFFDIDNIYSFSFIYVYTLYTHYCNIYIYDYLKNKYKVVKYH